MSKATLAPDTETAHGSDARGAGALLALHDCPARVRQA
ncbi:hypothetical protein C7S14_0711 [Burkholderia cepacia]|nr:hypothetical protein C7S14_0711 [Burkholderia cepacia]